MSGNVRKKVPKKPLIKKIFFKRKTAKPLTPKQKRKRVARWVTIALTTGVIGAGSIKIFMKWHEMEFKKQEIEYLQDKLRRDEIKLENTRKRRLIEEERKPTQGHDPNKDVEFLEREIDLWFLKIIENNWAKISKIPEKDFRKRVNLLTQNLSGVKILEIHIEKALKKLGLDDKRFGEWNEENKEEFAKKCRELSKPIVIAANKCDLPNAKENIEKMREAFPDKVIVACSAASELALRKANEQQIVKYYPGDKNFEIVGDVNEKQKEGLETIRSVLETFSGTGVQDCLDKTIFDLLDYIAVFPGGTKGLADKDGNIIPDCFLLVNGSTALDFAFYLHTDIGKNFIRAVDVKTKQIIGKEHPLKMGDVIEIIFNKP